MYLAIATESRKKGVTVSAGLDQEGGTVRNASDILFQLCVRARVTMRDTNGRKRMILMMRMIATGIPNLLMKVV